MVTSERLDGYVWEDATLRHVHDSLVCAMGDYVLEEIGARF